MNFKEAKEIMEKKGLKAPDEFTDGIRMINIDDIPEDAPAEINNYEISVRIPLPHHKKPHQGWVYGYYSK
jgi:hypothetical protein